MDRDQLQGHVARINEQLAAEGKGPFQWKTIPQGAATSVWAGLAAPAERLVRFLGSFPYDAKTP